MKNVFAFFLLISLSFGFSQIVDRDSLSGGSFSINGVAEIDSLIQKTVEITCYEPPEEEEKENMDPCANNTKIMGYKIQIVYSKDRTAANKVLKQFSSDFPYLVPELVYTQPDYRVLAGDYFSKRSAAPDLVKIKKKYPGSFLVQWRVWCRKAK